ncbi:hypothetical protein B0H19DRAFT_1365149 [Mycena capillaripes]|nr:hypothetical protein B0H19DRAFT_1365149 [Mycena capillaripes]
MAIKKLKLTYTPNLWYDSNFRAGTGCRESLILEAIAILGGKKKVIVMVCALTALEADQVKQASAKAISAIEFNKDNTNDSNVWRKSEKHAQLIYISPNGTF